MSLQEQFFVVIYPHVGAKHFATFIIFRAVLVENLTGGEMCTQCVLVQI